MRKLLEMIRRLARSRSARLIGPAAACAFLAACALSQAHSDHVTKTLTALLNKNTEQLKTIEAQSKVLIGGLPADQHGYDCAAAALVVQADLQKLVDAGKGHVIGALSEAEFISIIGPGSRVFEYEFTTLETGCIAKLHDLNHQVLGAAANAAMIGAFLGL
jgi:hypothetical protein